MRTILKEIEHWCCFIRNRSERLRKRVRILMVNRFEIQEEAALIAEFF